MATSLLNPESVVIPGRGIVMMTTSGPIKTQSLNLDTIKKYLPGASGSIGTDTIVPIGYTSLDDLPVIEPDVSGGEKVGVWENPNLRHTPIEIDWSLTVNVVSWNKTTAKLYFGGASTAGASNFVAIPGTFKQDPQSLIVGFKETDERWLGFCFYKCVSQPAGEISASSDGFMTMPVKFTIEPDGIHDELGFMFKNPSWEL